MIELVLVLIIMAFIMEIVDSSLGMMYGTLLSPILIGYGFEPIIVIPAILISQAVGGISGTISHHKFKNADFKGLTRDTKIMLAMVIPGLFVVILGAFAAVSLPKIWVKTYIGILVVVMSVLCLSPVRYKFAWWKHYMVGVVAAFNKALTGGGFGPVTSTGGIIGGLESKVSIATTTYAEVFICLSAFVAYIFLYGSINIVFVSSLCIGAIIGGLIGPYISSRISHKSLRIVVGILGIVSGIWLLLKVINI
ncbi:MAG: sulfite exporter TauE/SafE family protein [Candidatus Thermoplasmatota archaeon]|nr:sulfite exporter TauE/SafE family protein [Candidatus Thermoplasmatota archaeon]MCG2825948.1 sulfite exporter TauE/SafE family protein [Thermoplasmatales archaeon]